MDRLGPFEPHPTLAAAVSGGADSMALAVLTRDWVRARGGSVLALVVDHALRPASGTEAETTVDRLHQLGITARLLTMSNLSLGTGLAERARIARYEILTAACAGFGILHLLLGHHLGDQAETLAMRVLRGSQNAGLAGMSALRETPGLRLLRPLLGTDPRDLRRLLTERGIAWVEDPSNQNLLTMRARMRQGLAGSRLAETGIRQALIQAGRLREHQEAATAAELAERATIRPEGFAILSPGRIGPAALAAVIQTISGAPYPPHPDSVAVLAAQPKPATIAGVRMLAAGRFGSGWLLIREEAAIAAPVPATDGTIWDGRFRLNGGAPPGATIGKLGGDAARFRRARNLPSAVLRTLPAVRFGELLASVPHLGYTNGQNKNTPTVLFNPNRPAANAWFVPSP
jgi:tRNA(Ile)-lysidine synthase